MIGFGRVSPVILMSLTVGSSLLLFVTKSYLVHAAREISSRVASLR